LQHLDLPLKIDICLCQHRERWKSCA